MVTVAAVVVAIVTTIVVADGKPGPKSDPISSSTSSPISSTLSSTTSGYAAQLGSAGTSPSLQLPQQVGVQKLSLSDDAPIWTGQPGLLPTSPAATFATVSGSYYDLAQKIGVEFDGVYAIGSALGSAQRRGVFSVSPTALESLITQQLDITDIQQYPAGPDGGLLECGTEFTVPTCVWADQSTLGFVYYEAYVGNPGSVASLAALAAAFRSAAEYD